MKNEEEELKENGLDDIQVADPLKKAEPKKTKPVKKISGDLFGKDKVITGNLLEDDLAQQQEFIQQREEKIKKRGPKIDKNVMVKICDMGNGCWTYHHFTPEI